MFYLVCLFVFLYCLGLVLGELARLGYKGIKFAVRVFRTYWTGL